MASCFVQVFQKHIKSIRKYRNLSFRPYVINRYKVVCCCLYMSSKYIGKPALCIEQLYDMTSQKFSLQDIISFQAQILLMIQYNMNLPNLLIFQLQSEKHSQDQKQKMSFLTEILLLQDLSIVQDQNKFSQIVAFVHKTSDQLKPTLQKALQVKQAQDLIKKYQSVFQVDLYLHQISA